MPFTASDICKIILAVILPPVGVFLEVGCGSHLLINILLTILGTYTCLAQLSSAPPPQCTRLVEHQYATYPTSSNTRTLGHFSARFACQRHFSNNAGTL
ncbi:hypothetical protein E4U23_004304 [Claviceps purpurea]|nr:hypothetical protein E4U23_004304 [Claviceps purpurea]